MNQTLLAIAVALACLAGVVAAVTAKKAHTPPSHQARADTPAARKSPRASAAPYADSSGGLPSSRESRVREDGDTSRAEALRSTALTAAIDSYPSRVELERRAALVEQEANHELRRIVPLLDLKPDQEERVFKALVRSSPNFVPGLAVGGETLAAAPANSPATSGSPTTAASQIPAAVLAELTDAQIAAYLQDSDERAAWWQEYLAKVSSELESETPASGSTDSGTTTTPAATTGSGIVLPQKSARPASNVE